MLRTGRGSSRISLELIIPRLPQGDTLPFEKQVARSGRWSATLKKENPVSKFLFALLWLMFASVAAIGAGYTHAS